VNGADYGLLLVDDEPAILAALRRTLRGRGYRIFVADDPVAALKLLDRERVDLVVSDLDMPTMNGLDFVARVRVAFPHVVRILLTGRGTLDAALRAINDGEVHRFLTKPWDEDELRTTVAQALERLEELRRAQVADRTTARRRMLMADLEREHPGIGTITKDPDGVYVLDDTRVDDVRVRVGGELAKVLG
jgi:DNA-binding NtrC family response regulator